MLTQMAPEQEAYAIAKTFREMMEKDLAKKTKQIDPKDPTWAEKVEALYTEAGYYGLLDTCHAAEKRLLEWAHERIRTLPQYAGHRADMEKVFNCRYPHLREKLIDTCMRLRV